jgi:hypothetical protein
MLTNILASEKIANTKAIGITTITTIFCKLTSFNLLSFYYKIRLKKITRPTDQKAACKQADAVFGFDDQSDAAMMKPTRGIKKLKTANP